ncbi:Cleavage and polyadenylation specificity factor subunit 1 [Frankliniella fusca]|uniref:Cleavage and polyadenylation specificity factor subunit 1 n=1 Tax=Frankliniella fusca TaxID=407009 RepID=A0AAE1LMI7_9NEOP|nr:Cleavage and polyadenylation specificity factor subunit 1 [Frankliniella fusca]
MFSVCRQTHPATAVEHAITCHFFNRSERSLVVAGANILRVFRLVPDAIPNKNEIQRNRGPPVMKLECLATYHLFGNVMSLQAVSLAGSGRDALLLSFRDAKLSLVEYDLDTHNLKTLSLHYFEEEDMRGGWMHNFHIPMVRVDPEGRCAAMLVYGRKLVVLPFRHESVVEDPDATSAEVKGSGTNNTGTSVMASYMIVLKDLDEKMDNVIDIQFLHGYYEPTVLILYEPVRTFPGRIAVRQDTCCMVAISLNIMQRVHPVIWSVSNLPFDCVQALAIEKPLGGTLIFTTNAIIYLNQSVPPFGVSLNSVTDISTNFPLKAQEGVCMTLEGAQAAFLSHDRVVLSLKNGELYVLTIYADSMRSVRSFHFEKAAASVLTTCMCICEENYLFLGSRLGNSLLLRFTEKEQSTTLKLEERREPVAKKKRLDTLGDWMASDVADIRDPDELEVYGREHQASTIQIASYIFEVCDSLLNIGPCGDVAMGEPAFLSEEFSSNTQDPDIELVTTSGYGKNGALCVLQRSVRPQVVTTFELPGCIDMWTVISSSHVSDDISVIDNDPTHAFLILSQRSSTMVLQTGREINEVDQSGFSTEGATVYAGNLGLNKYIIQVSQLGVRLLQGDEQLQHIPLDLGSPVTFASSADPYVVILTEDGQVMLLTLREGRGETKLHVTRPPIPLKPLVTALCTYRDVSGLLTFSLPEDDNTVTQEETAQKVETAKNEVDDEDELLYGDTDPTTLFTMPNPVETQSSTSKKSVPWWHKLMQRVEPSFWLFLIRENGLMEIYSLPEFKLSYIVRGLGQGLRVLTDSLEATPTPVAQGDSGLSTDLLVRELLVVGLGHHGNQPLLLARTDDELLIYQIYRYPRGNLKIRFSKVNHSVLIRERKTRGKKAEDRLNRVSQLRYFGNIAGYNGVFVCGAYPHWLFLTARGELRSHPMNIDGPVMCFAPFHNINCPQGFLYFNKKELSEEERGERFPLPLQEHFSILLFSPVSWEVIPNTRIELDDWEHVTCLKTVSLAYEGTRSGLKGYVAVGTNYNYGEDVTSRGRIIIYDIIEVVPEPGQPLTKNRFKCLYSKEQKGPVTAISQVLGFLVSAVGQKIYIWQLKDDDLVGVAFIDTQIYIHQIITIKNMILAADVFKSISLLRFQEEYRTLSLDFRPCEVINVEFMIDNTQLGFLVSDAEKNIVLYTYQPEARESCGGQRLMRKADFHLGQHGSKFFRIRCKLNDIPPDRRQAMGADKRHINMFGKPLSLIFPLT